MRQIGAASPQVSVCPFLSGCVCAGGRDLLSEACRHTDPIDTIVFTLCVCVCVCVFSSVCVCVLVVSEEDSAACL